MLYLVITKIRWNKQLLYNDRKMFLSYLKSHAPSPFQNPTEKFELMEVRE